MFSQFIAVGSDFASKSVIVLTPLIVDGLWYTIITLLLSSPKLIDKIRSQAQLIDRLSGIILILLAIRVVYTV
ncbi:putative threonine efflux protein [Vibrio ponticus]|nr:putative threonine efflux protein [Vibrio ponticus]